MVHICFSDEEIRTTENHPFYVVGKGWTVAKELRVGDALKLSNDESILIESIETENFDKSVKVYNFEVQDWHTYFVSKSNVFVHNMCTKPRKVNVSKNVERQVKKLSPEAKKGYEKALEALEKNDTRGLNEHSLTGNRKGQWAIDIKGTGKGRGKGVIIYEKINDGKINVIEILTDHNY